MSPSTTREKKHHSGSPTAFRYACPYAAMGRIQRHVKNSPCSGKGYEDIPHFIEHIKKSHSDHCSKSDLEKIQKTRRVSKQKTAEEKVIEIYQILFGCDVAIPNVHVQSLEYLQYMVNERPEWLNQSIQTEVEGWTNHNASYVLSSRPDFALDVVKLVLDAVQKGRGQVSWNNWTPDSYPDSHSDSWPMSSSDDSAHEYGYSSNSPRSSGSWQMSSSDEFAQESGYSSNSPTSSDSGDGMENFDFKKYGQYSPMDSHMSQ